MKIVHYSLIILATLSIVGSVFPAASAESRKPVSFAKGMTPDKTFTGSYRGGSSAKGKQFGRSMTPDEKKRMDEKVKVMADDAKLLAQQLALYVEDEELGFVNDILKDGTRIWIDTMNHRYRLLPHNFDASGNLTQEARKKLRSAQIANGTLSRVPHVNTVVEEVDDEDNIVVPSAKSAQSNMALVPATSVQSEVAGLFQSVSSQDVASSGHQRVITRTFIDMLRSMDNDQLVNVLSNILTIPELTVPYDAQNITIRQLQEVYFGTIDLAGNITDSLLDMFLQVRCESIETLSLYTLWLQQRLVPAMTELFMYRKSSVEKYYSDARDQKYNSLLTELDDLSKKLTLVDSSQRRTMAKGGAAMTVIGVAPFAAPHALPLSDKPMIRSVLYVAAFGLAVYEFTLIIDRLNKQDRTRAQLKRTQTDVTEDLDVLQSLPKEMSQGTIEVYNQKLGAFVGAMQARIHNLTLEESRRIEAELQALQAAAVVPAIDSRSESASEERSMVPVVTASTSMSKKEVAVKGLSLVLRGISFVARNLQSKS